MGKYLENVSSVIDAVGSVVSGKDEVVRLSVMTILAKGHILIEDIPGVGKTTLALALSRAMQLDYKRLQFTPDVLPTDVVGYRMYSKSGEDMGYHEGSIMCNLFLADEINRTSPKTQSALLEVMEEGHVTVDGVTKDVPKPFHVIATQNPIGSAGTQPLPESQLDRFMVRISMGYPDVGSEVALMRQRNGSNPLDKLESVINACELGELQQVVEQVFVHDAIYDYIARLAAATRSHELIVLGVSPRGSLAVTSMAKAAAFLSGRDYVIPEDIVRVYAPAVIHRMVLNARARVNNITLEKLIEGVLEQTPQPRLIQK